MSGPERHITVMDGRDLIGGVTGIDCTWRAFDARGNQLRGKFETMKEAVAAVNASAPPVCNTGARRDNSA